MNTAINHSTQSTDWQSICAIDDIWPNTGVCALVNNRQVAIFRLRDDRLFAIDNHDPHSNANVLSRGIVGDLGGEPVVASPIYKDHYQLRTGTCIEKPDTRLAIHQVENRDGVIWLQLNSTTHNALQASAIGLT
jgi:nitrite reductase (NADH) small subunit